MAQIQLRNCKQRLKLRNAGQPSTLNMASVASPCFSRDRLLALCSGRDSGPRSPER
jgi:hypothetical protein